MARLASDLPPNVSIVQADVLDVDLAPLVAPGPLRVAGNLPYNITSPILFRLIHAFRAHGGLQDATVMVQREVADRIVAAPGGRDYGVLSISVQLHADVARLLVLPPGAFRPPPKVHSTVIRLAFRPPAVALADERVFEAMVRAMFAQRRKMLGNALAAFAGTRGADAHRALTASGLDPRRRAETLQLTELARLADHFSRETP